MRAAAVIPPFFYLFVAIAILWPATQIGTHWVPGGQWTDVWNSIWAMEFAHQSILNGHLPWVANMLGHPHGGAVLLPDFWGAVFAVPAVGLVGPESAMTAWVTIQLALTGWVTHLFARDWLETSGLKRENAHRASWVAGIGHMASPVILAGAQCGTTEAVSGGWLALAVWSVWRTNHHRSRQSTLLAGLALWAATLSGWYTTVLAFLFASCLCADGARKGGVKALLPIGLGLVFAIPFAMWTHSVHTDPTHLATRAPEVLDRIRASFGAATPLGMIWPIDEANIAIGSPKDLGQGYLHTGYLGLTLLVAAAVGVFNRMHSTAVWLTAGVAAAILSWGPGTHGQLPYALVELIPGTDSLSLVWRLAGGAALTVALLAAAASRGKPLVVAIIIAAFCAEIRWVSPVSQGVATSNTQSNAALSSLAEAPPGAVLTLPIQHQALWLQTQHKQPITGSINMRRSHAAQQWVSASTSNEWSSSKQDAQALGIRYVAVKQSPLLQASPDRLLAHRLSNQETPMVRAGRWAVYKLW